MEKLYSKRSLGGSVNIIREIAKKIAQGGIISLAGGNPDPNTFPVTSLSKYAEKVITEKPVQCLQYGVTAGYPELRELVVEHLKKHKGIETTKENILLTSGSQQGIALIASVFLDEGDEVIIEDPTYVAALQIFRPYFVKMSPVAINEDGVIYEKLEKIAKEGNAKLFYSVTNFQNPTSVCMAEETRQKMPKLLDECEMLMVEDDPYGEIYFDAPPPNPVKSIDENEKVIYMGSFSKVIAPGLRVGYIVASKEIIAKLEVAKQAADLNSCNLSQVLLTEYLKSGEFEPHLDELRRVYKEKRDSMVEAAKKYFPESVKVYTPKGGLFLWAELPEKYDSFSLLETAMERGVAYIPAVSFYANKDVKNTMRLNFSGPSLADMDKGMKILGDLLKEVIE